MTYEQVATRNEIGYGRVEVAVRIAENYSELTNPQETATITGFVLKRLQKSFGETGLKVNSVLEFDFYDRGWGGPETDCLAVILGGGYIGVFIDGEPIYQGKIDADYRKEILAEKIDQTGKTLKVVKYSFSSQPVSVGHLNEIKVRDVIEKISDSEWEPLIKEMPLGAGIKEGDNYNPIKVKGKIKDGSGHYIERYFYYRGKVVNLMNLNSFLKLFCQKATIVLNEKLGTTDASISIPTFTIPGRFYPSRMKIQPSTFLIERFLDIRSFTEDGNEIDISSEVEEEGRSFYIDAGVFAINYSKYQKDKTMWGDDYARWKEWKDYIEKNIFELTLEQFFNKLGANFGLQTRIATTNFKNFEVIYEMPEIYSKVVEVMNETKVDITFNKQKTTNKTYDVHFTYFDKDEWSENYLQYVKLIDMELEPIPYHTKIQKIEGEKEELIFGFFPRVAVINGVGSSSSPPAYWWMLYPVNGVLEKLELDYKIERSNKIPNRMLFIKTNKITGEYETQPEEEWVPVLCYVQNPSLSWGGGTWTDFLKWLFDTFGLKLSITHLVNSKLTYEYHKEMEMELPGFYKVKDGDGVMKWQYNDLGNAVNWMDETWKIVETEYNFENWMVRLRCRS